MSALVDLIRASLEYLIANQNRIMTREQFAVKIWGYEFPRCA